MGVVKKQVDSIATLFRYKADPNTEDGVCFVLAVDAGDTDIVKLFLKQPDFNPYSGEIDKFLENYDSIRKDANFSETRFSHPDIQEIVRLVLEARESKKSSEVALREKAKTDASQPTTRSFLQAVSDNDIDKVSSFLAQGMDPGVNGNEAVCVAALRGNDRMVDLLAEAGADPTANNSMPIRLAAMRGHNNVLKTLVQKHKVSPDGFEADGRPLIAAIMGKYSDTVRFLVNELQANPNVLDGWPLAIALETGEVESARILLAAGANTELIPVIETLDKIIKAGEQSQDPKVQQVALMISEARKGSRPKPMNESLQVVKHP